MIKTENLFTEKFPKVAKAQNFQKKDRKPKIFKKNFGSLSGETLKTSPRGFAKDHPDVDLLRHKQFLISRNFTDKEALSENFTQEASNTFKAMRPFFDFMSEVLTTNENGESIV